jgi:hypothetical protein
LARVQGLAQGLAGAGDEDRADMVRGMGLEWAEKRLERALEKLAEMPAGSGRNNRLNQIAFFQGAALVWLGEDQGKIADRIGGVARSAGTHGVDATVKSGLRAGVRALGQDAAAVQA